MIFANKFVYFVVAAFLFFGLIITIAIFDDPNFNEAVIYGFLVFPGLLLIFYPMAYGIQNDDDSKMLETIFGIPNYRYKVWLVRFVITAGVAASILLVLAALANFTLLRFDILPMLGQVMFPIVFLSSVASDGRRPMAFPAVPTPGRCDAIFTKSLCASSYLCNKKNWSY